MSFDRVLDRLYVGDYETARDLNTLETLGITHIVACGFDSGHFQHLGYDIYFSFLYFFVYHTVLCMYGTNDSTTHHYFLIQNYHDRHTQKISILLY
jgi:hypothetical protein